MEEPGPRRRPRRPLIIERPDLQSPAQRLVSGVLTAVFWGLWVYIWLPVVGVLGWWFGLSTAYEQMVVFEGWRAVLELAGWYGLGIAAFAGSLIVWAVYNRLRFRGVERRAAVRPVRLSSLARRARVEPAELLLWQEARSLRVMHDRRGRIESVLAFGQRRAGRPAEPVTVPLSVRTPATQARDAAHPTTAVRRPAAPSAASA